MRLQSKAAFISGGARGMGAAVAKTSAGEGAKVVIGDVLDEDWRQTEAAINEVGGECLFVHLDVTDEAVGCRLWRRRSRAFFVRRSGSLDRYEKVRRPKPPHFSDHQ